MGDDPRPFDQRPLEQTQPMRTVPPAGQRLEPRVRGTYVRTIDDAPHAPVAVPNVVLQMLLPEEGVAFTTRPHPIVVARPFAACIATLLVVGILLAVPLPALPRGGFLTPALAEHLRTIVVGLGGLVLGFRALASLVRGTAYYLGGRVVATNRRVLVLSGVLRRTVRPLGNTAMAGSTLAQGVLGRSFGFGSVVMGGETVADVREPGTLYRFMHEAANGIVEGKWSPAVRQTTIP